VVVCKGREGGIWFDLGKNGQDGIGESIFVTFLRTSFMDEPCCVCVVGSYSR